jgi:RNA recognition motif-containing protein
MTEENSPVSLGNLSLSEISSSTPSPTNATTTTTPAVHPLDFPPHSRLFIKGASEAMTDEFLQATFQVYGELDHIQVVYTKDTNEPKGFAFVKFRTAENAKNALKGICDTNGGLVKTNQGNTIHLEVTVAQPRGVRKVRQKPKTKDCKTSPSNASSSKNGNNLQSKSTESDTKSSTNKSSTISDGTSATVSAKSVATSSTSLSSSSSSPSIASSSRRRKRTRKSANSDNKNDNTITNPNSASGVPSATRRRVRRGTPSPQPKQTKPHR